MHLTIICKTPVPGRVKTRLCPPCTPAEAAAVARAGIADTIDALDAVVAGMVGSPGAPVPVRRVLLLDGEPEPWMPASYDIVAQRGAGLAERLANGFADLGPGVIVGMETPIAARSLGMALAVVGAGDDTLGLATDGGYWSIGLGTVDDRVADLFSGVPMSVDTTGAAQLAALLAAGRTVHRLPTARDLDDFDDLRSIADGDGNGRLTPLARQIVARVTDLQAHPLSAVPSGR